MHDTVLAFKINATISTQLYVVYEIKHVFILCERTLKVVPCECIIVT